MRLIYSTLVVIGAVVMGIKMVDGGYSMTKQVSRSSGGRMDGTTNADGTQNVVRDENLTSSATSDAYVKYNPKTCNAARDCGDPNNPRYFCVAFNGGNICKRPQTKGKFCSPFPEDEEKQVYRRYPPCNTRTRPPLNCTLVVQDPPAWGCLPARKTKSKPKPKPKEKFRWF